MRYNSIGEYFYRLSNRCLGFVLLPVLIVLAAYVSNHYFLSGLPWFKVNEDMLEEMLLAEIGIKALLIICMIWLGSAKIKALKVEPSLSKRMTGYIPIVMVRFRMFSLMLLVVGICIFLTGELIHLVILPIPVILILVYWPIRWRMAKDLHLKPEEREILREHKLGV